MTTPQPKHHFLFDSEQLHALATDANISLGLAWFKENRVVLVGMYQDDELQAVVEDPDSNDNLNCEIHPASDGYHIRCDCGTEGSQACAHMIAALYAHAARDADAPLLSAAEHAIDLRIKRGRTEVDVEPINQNNQHNSWFGDWKAASINTDSHFSHSYRVNIRSLTQRNNYCNCPDFATNQLGTCKHIEAVLHKIRKHPDQHALQAQPAPTPYVFLNWNTDQPPRISVHRTPNTDPSLSSLLDTYFDAAGHFRLTLPDDFFRFSEQVRDRADIAVGEDAIGQVRRLAANASQQLRGQSIRATIRASQGHLPGIKAKLYPYQMEGVAFLAANGRALLADDMGLGKTLQAIAAAHWLYQHAQVKRILIVCPASLKHQWAREIEKFTDLPVQIIQGSPAGRSVQYHKGDGFYILNYELVLRDLSVINTTLAPDLLILDEAQRIKNWQTKIAAAVKLIHSRYAFVLSGTPLENRLEDLYSLMQVVDPNVLGPLWRYLADFHVTDERGKVLGYRNLSTLRQRLAPVMLRRDRRLVSDQLPQRIEQRLDVEMTTAQYELHDAALQAAGQLAELSRRRPLTPSEQNRMMSALQQARMACNAAGLVDKETVGSPKLDELVNIVQDLCVQEGLKAVVFSQWELMTQLVEERLRGIGVGCVRLHGGVPTHKRGDLTDRFHNDDAIQVFISTDAGGTGLNLQNASVLINLDIPWNPAILDQRIARVHRLGQKKTVQAILLVSSDSYEERVMALVKGKRHLFDNVIDQDASEDIVGVSRKLLDVLRDDLSSNTPVEADTTSTDPAPDDEEDESATAMAALAAPTPASQTEAHAPHGFAAADTADTGLENALQTCIAAIQQHFGTRVGRILGSNGGLLVILDQVTADDEQTAEALSTEIIVALLDPLTLRSLQRLGTKSPLGETTVYHEAALPEPEPEVPKPSALAMAAKHKLEAALILLEQEHMTVGLHLLTDALLAAAADRAGQDKAPTTAEAGLWLYAEALPNGWLTAEDAELLMRNLALAQAPSLPTALLEGLITDVQQFVV